MGARLAVVRLLDELSRPGRRLDALSTHSLFDALSGRDRRLVMELAYGVERRRGSLDYWITQLSQRPIAKIDRLVLWILRSGLYQIEYLRIPERAAVHESVEVCRQLGKSSAAGFVNALLRRFLRCPPGLPEGDSAADLSVRFSHPQWLVERYLNRWGPMRTRAFLERNNLPPEGCLWVNPRKASLDWLRSRLDQQGIACRTHPRLPGCLIVPTSLARHPLYRRGYCFFMDAASQQVAQMASLQGRRRLGDFCAAPGGKAFLLASHMDRGALLHCTDISWARLDEVRRRARLYRIGGLTYSVADWARSIVFQSLFDFVLLDVPCSGLGTLQSNPDIRWKFRPQDLPRMAQRQSAILQNAFRCLRRGGELVYSTCSTEPEENEQVVDGFLKGRLEARREGEDFRSFPLPYGSEGFYAARIRHV